MVERFNGRIGRNVLVITVGTHRSLERLLQGYNVAYNARRQRVLKGKAPNDSVKARLRRKPVLANSHYRPPDDPCRLQKAMVVVEHAKDVSHPDTCRVLYHTVPCSTHLDANGYLL